MAKLIFVKHSLPEVDPLVSARQWRLGEAGHLRCKLLADKLATYLPAVIVTSVELKAVETAAIVAAHLGASFEQIENLHEHDRSNGAFLSNNEFQQSIATFFKRPEELGKTVLNRGLSNRP